jgi:hypothetical protein
MVARQGDDEQADAAAAPATPEAPPAAAAGDEITATVIVVTVTRTGGIAGLKKQWSAEPPAADEEHWVALIDDCPWDVTISESRGADRYVWRIDARLGDRTREARLPDQAVAGPWRTLVDEVQQAAAQGS